MASRGILYSAIGEKFTNEAFASAASSRRFNKVPHIIFTDIDCQPPLDGATIEPHQSTGNPYADKIMAMSKSSFDETIFLDTDTFVCREITDLFDLLSRFDMAVAHAPADRETPDPGIPAAFFNLNTGVVPYRRSAAMLQFLSAWRATYRNWTVSPPFPGAGLDHGPADQPAFRHCLWESALNFYVLPAEYNYRSIFPGRAVAAVKIIHGRSDDYEQLESVLNEYLGMRTFGPFPEPLSE